MAFPFQNPMMGGQQPDPMMPPRVPWAQNPLVTAAGIGLLSGRNLNQGFENVAQMMPGAMVAKGSQQQFLMKHQEDMAERERQKAAMNAGLKMMSGQTLTPEEQAAYAGSPDVALKFETLKASQTPQPTDDMREFAEAQKNPAFGDWMLRQKQAGATNVTVGMGDNAADGKLRGKLSEEEGTRWSTIQKVGTVAAGRNQDFEVLGELLKQAPQGPITGRLADMFPGFSSAGDAANAIIYRTAPSLRVEGSGATSDLEYEGMLKSLPGLSKNPMGNQIILETMMAKNAVDMERAAIVTAYQNEEISAKEARNAMMELDRRSILTPQAKALITQAAGVVAPDDEPAPAGVDAEDWKYMTPDQRALFR